MDTGTGYKTLDFDEINFSFLKFFPDLNIFKGTAFNYFKIAQHAHSFMLIEAKDKILKGAKIRRYFLFRIIQGIRKFFKPPPPMSPISNSTLILENNKYIQLKGKSINPLTNIICSELKDYSRWDISGRFIDDDGVSFSTHNFNKYFFEIDIEMKDIYIEIREVYNRVEAVLPRDHDFLKYFQSALIIFFETLRAYYYWLKLSRPRELIFVCHYHNEGIIAACKILGIRCIEIQHGLISRRDIYYVYPEAFRSFLPRAFFPDEIWLLGQYWRDLFNGSAEEGNLDLVVVGDFRSESLNDEIEQEKENILLICSQTNLHGVFVDYIKMYSANFLLKHPTWRLVVKLHPLEKEVKLYEELTQYGVEIAPIDSFVNYFLSKAKIQVSVYSTTLFDALKFDVSNYILKDTGYCNEYTEELIEEGVAFPISVFDDPIQIFLDNKSLPLLSKTYVYQEFINPLVGGS